jgi:hypothetical protein
LEASAARDPQPMPERLRGNTLVDQAQQFIELSGSKTWANRRLRAFRKALAVITRHKRVRRCQQGKEAIQARLHGTPDAREQKCDQIREGQITLASEIPVLTASRFQETGAMDKGREPRKYVDIFRPSYLAYKYQLVSAHITPKVGSSPRAAMKYAKTLSHED